MRAHGQGTIGLQLAGGRLGVGQHLASSRTHPKQVSAASSR
jgi:hypothetical protein